MTLGFIAGWRDSQSFLFSRPKSLIGRIREEEVNNILECSVHYTGSRNHRSIEFNQKEEMNKNGKRSIRVYAEGISVVFFC